MKLWLVCFLLLFFSAEGLQWLGQFHWASAPTLPQAWIVLAGIGLAIASNVNHWPAWPAMTDRTTLKAPSAPKPTPIQPGPTVAPPAIKPARDKSISFEIRKPG